MPDFNIDYESFNNSRIKRICQSADTDNIKGLSSKEEIIEVFNQAYKEGIELKTVNEILGLDLSNIQKVSKAPAAQNLPQLINYYNSLEPDSYERGSISYAANNIGYEILSNLEQDINIAFEECKGYALIKLRPDRFEDKTRFDIKEVQQDVQTALDSLNELRDKIESAYDNAKGITNHIPPDKPEYNLDEIAQRILGMSFDDFVKNNNLDFTKSITEADAYNPNYENKALYDKAKAYVKEIKKLAREELQNMRYNSSERFLNETVLYSNSFIELIGFESSGISQKALDSMSSDIMKKAFIDAISEAYKTSGIDEHLNEAKQPDKYYDKKLRKIIIKGYNADGTKSQ